MVAVKLNSASVTSFISMYLLTCFERPEAVGIYLFSKRIFDYLHNESIETHDGLCFDLSHDILEQIPRTVVKLFSFNLGENIEWIDIESPAYAERHKDVIKKYCHKWIYYDRDDVFIRTSRMFDNFT
jgi:NDP-sugar pyrophosphorylase family protein